MVRLLELVVEVGHLVDRVARDDPQRDGLLAPAVLLVRDDDGVWAYTEPDWEKLQAVVSGNGPASAERIAFRKLSRAEIDWVSRTVLAEAA